MSQGETVGASKAIRKFINEIWEALDLPDEWRPRGTPSEQREQAILILKDRMDEVGDFYYKRGAINSIRALNQLRRKAGEERATKGVVRKRWAKRIRRAFPEAAKHFDAGKRPW